MVHKVKFNSLYLLMINNTVDVRLFSNIIIIMIYIIIIVMWSYLKQFCRFVVSSLVLPPPVS